jgi:hypothetical protein
LKILGNREQRRPLANAAAPAPSPRKFPRCSN